MKVEPMCEIFHSQEAFFSYSHIAYCLLLNFPSYQFHFLLLWPGSESLNLWSMCFTFVQLLELLLSFCNWFCFTLWRNFSFGNKIVFFALQQLFPIDACNTFDLLS